MNMSGMVLDDEVCVKQQTTINKQPKIWNIFFKLSIFLMDLFLEQKYSKTQIPRKKMH